MCMQGNCAQPPPATFAGGKPKDPLKPRQCIVSAQRSAFRVFSKRLWVDNVAMLWRVPEGGAVLEEPPGLAVWDINTPTESGRPGGRAVYLTNTTFSGPSTPQIQPLRVWQASAVMLQGVYSMHERHIRQLCCYCLR